MEKVLCLNCNKPVDITNSKGFHRCDCGTLNSMDAMIDMFILKQQNCKKSGNGARYWLIDKSVCMGDEVLWYSSIKK